MFRRVARRSEHRVEHDSPQLPGARHGARDTAVALAEGAAEWRADLAGAYPDGPVDRWSRTVRLAPASSRTPAHIVVEDDPEPVPDRFLLRHVRAGDVRLDNGFAVARAEGGRARRVSWDPALPAADAEVRPLEDPELRASWGGSPTRLTLSLRTGACLRAGGPPGCASNGPADSRSSRERATRNPCRS